MSSNLHAKQARAYLEELCQAIDRKEKIVRRRQWWKSPLLMPAAVGLAMGVAGCGGTVEKPTSETAEVCNNQVDDDGDGKVDCDDTDCSDSGMCNTALYAAPAENCTNGEDDDGDGKVDCADDDCYSDSACASAEYAAPFETCDNGYDDDGDGDVDCADEDCYDHAACQGMPAYAAPMVEQCDKQLR